MEVSGVPPVGSRGSPPQQHTPAFGLPWLWAREFGPSPGVAPTSPPWPPAPSPCIEKYTYKQASTQSLGATAGTEGGFSSTRRVRTSRGQLLKSPRASRRGGSPPVPSLHPQPGGPLGDRLPSRSVLPAPPLSRTPSGSFLLPALVVPRPAPPGSGGSRPLQPAWVGRGRGPLQPASGSPSRPLPSSPLLLLLLVHSSSSPPGRRALPGALSPRAEAELARWGRRATPVRGAVAARGGPGAWDRGGEEGGGSARFIIGRASCGHL